MKYVIVPVPYTCNKQNLFNGKDCTIQHDVQYTLHSQQNKNKKINKQWKRTYRMA